MKTGVRVFLWLTGAIAALLVAGLLVTLVMVNHSKAELHKYEAELTARGETLDAVKLAPPKTPDDKNGAKATLEALRDLKILVGKNKYSRLSAGQKETTPGFAEIGHQRPEPFVAGNKGNPKSWPDVAKEYSSLQPVLKTLREALHHPVQAVDLDCSMGFSMPLDHVTLALLGAQYLSMDAQIQLQQGDITGAVADLEAIVRLTRLADQPLLICRLVQFSILGLAQGGTWDILQAKNIDQDGLLRLQQAWERIPTFDIAATLRIERAAALPVLATSGFKAYRARKNMFTFSTTPPPAWQKKAEEMRDRAVFEIWNVAFRYADERALLANYQTLVEKTLKKDVPWQEVVDQENAINHSLKEAGLGRLFSKMVFDSTRAVVERFGFNEAAQNMTVTAIAIRRYQLDHEGAAPQSLEMLMPQYLTAIPRDPMNGRALRYQPEADGFLLYSVGLGARDEGGDASAPPDRTAKSFLERKDIVWPRVAKPARKPTTP